MPAYYSPVTIIYYSEWMGSKNQVYQMYKINDLARIRDAASVMYWLGYMMISFSKSWLKPWWFLVIWFDLMPSCIPRNLHECTCRGSGRTWFRRARIPRLCRHGSWMCHVPTQDRQTPRWQTLWPSSWHGAHAHEPSHSEASRHQTRPTGTLIPHWKDHSWILKGGNFPRNIFPRTILPVFADLGGYLPKE